MSKCRTCFCICAACVLMMFSLIAACAPSDNNTQNITTSEESECISSTLSGSSSVEKNVSDESESPNTSQDYVINDIIAPEYVSDDILVLISKYAPDIILDIRYATTNNFTHSIIYESSDAYIRYGTLKKLIAAQTELRAYGLGLKIWDAYRPIEAQFKLWNVCPDSRFVANPNTGYSNHTRGNTVDVTLVTLTGQEVEMPSAFDDFSHKAHRDYSDDTPDAAINANLLESVMEKHGFTGYINEWWHFTDTTSYPVVQ